MSPAEKNLHDIVKSFIVLQDKVKAAGDTPKPPPPIVVSVCWQCDGNRFSENGDRCSQCGGKGTLATEGEP